jgi:hypothetical protein
MTTTSNQNTQPQHSPMTYQPTSQPPTTCYLHHSSTTNNPIITGDQPQPTAINEIPIIIYHMPTSTFIPSLRSRTSPSLRWRAGVYQQPTKAINLCSVAATRPPRVHTTNSMPSTTTLNPTPNPGSSNILILQPRTYHINQSPQPITTNLLLP